jgi:hypothetical protein
MSWRLVKDDDYDDDDDDDDDNNNLPGRPACSPSLCRLSYPNSHVEINLSSSKCDKCQQDFKFQLISM